jgi:hypothetical protein
VSVAALGAVVALAAAFRAVTHKNFFFVLPGVPAV